MGGMDNRDDSTLFLCLPTAKTHSLRFDMNALSDATDRDIGTKPPCTGLTSNALPEADGSTTGVSVRYAPQADKRWYVLRVSYGRTDKATPLLEREKIDYYLPMHRTVKLVNNKKRHVTEPLLTNLIFAHAGQRQMTLLLSDATRENPLSYYYNHFATDAYGKNPPLVVDDESMLNFIRLTSIDDEHIKLVSPQACRYRSGDTVIVTEGKFKGVRGKVARVSGQQRVVVELEGLCMVATAYIPTAFIKNI